MKLTIRIEMGNAAFEDAGELGRILQEVADRLSSPFLIGRRTEVARPIKDINGNTVGEWTVSPEKQEE